MPLIRKTKCQVTEIQSYGHGVFLIRLLAEKSLPAWKPGQFLHLAIDAYDSAGFWPDSRPFSIVNAPDGSRELELVYAVKGWFTHRLLEYLQPGREVWVKLPYGEFVIEKEQTGIVLIAGGTGISAFMAFLDTVLDDASQTVDLFYGFRDASVFLYEQKLKELMTYHPGLRVHLAVEVGGVEDWFAPVRQGLLDVGWILDNLESPAEKVFYLSGPPVMLTSFSQALRDAGIPADHIRKDAWE